MQILSKAQSLAILRAVTDARSKALRATPGDGNRQDDLIRAYSLERAAFWASILIDD